ncbi:MAG: ferrochelatase, partial [bacterium]|nr:ferrochelatase [bacterium]
MTRGILAVIFGGAENYEEAAAFLRSVSPHLTDSALENSVRRYAQLGFSPIKAQYREFLKALEDTLGEPCALGCLHGTPSVAQACADLKARGAERLLWFMSSPFAASGFDNAFEEAVLKNASLFKEITLMQRFSSFGFWYESWLASVSAELRGGQTEASDQAVLGDQRVFDAQAASDGMPVEGGQVSEGEHTLIFAAHSLPISMAGAYDYDLAFRSSAGWLARKLGVPWQVCFHSVPRNADP